MSDGQDVPAHNEQSPWMPVEDENGQVYYFNSETNETSWDPPSGWEEALKQTPPNQEEFNAVATDGGGEWQEMLDESSGRSYFYNPATEETSWENPYLKEQQHTVSNATDGSATIDGASDWGLYTDESGTSYYYNSATEETSWEAPDGFEGTSEAVDLSANVEYTGTNGMLVDADYLDASGVGATVTAAASDWVEQWDEDSGMAFYFNTATNETQWEMPADLLAQAELAVAGAGEGQLQAEYSPSEEDVNPGIVNQKLPCNDPPPPILQGTIPLCKIATPFFPIPWYYYRLSGCYYCRHTGSTLLSLCSMYREYG